MFDATPVTCPAPKRVAELNIAQEKGALRRPIEYVIPIYRLRLVQSLIWSSAWFRFSKELATLKRR